jgi:uncharacterized membrane protein
MVVSSDRNGGLRTIALVVVFATAVRLLMVFLIRPLIDVYYYDTQAVAALLSGSNPYGHLFTGIPAWLATPGAERVYAYMPGVILFLAPFGSIWDVRLGFIVADLVVAWSLYSLDGRWSATAALVFLLAPWSFLFSTSYPNNSLVGIAFLGLAFMWDAKGKTTLSAVAIGVSLASSQFAWLLYPFFLLRHLRARRFREEGVVLLVAALLVLPFLLWNPQPFLYDTITYQFSRPIQSIVTSEAFGFNVNPTLSGIAYTVFGVSVPFALKSMIVIALMLMFLYRSKDLQSLTLYASFLVLAAIFVLPDDFSWWYLDLPFQTLLTWFVLSRGGVHSTR